MSFSISGWSVFSSEHFLGDVIGHALLGPSLGEGVNLPDCHEVSDVILSNLCSFFLEIFHKFLQYFDKYLFDFSCEHLSLGVLLLDLFEFIIILEEEHEILEGDVHVEVGPIGAVLL